MKKISAIFLCFVTIFFSITGTFAKDYLIQRDIQYVKGIGIENNINITIEKPKKKSPVLAFGIAIVPGIFIHGAGHYYAGKKEYK